jgi:hypothetical protein
MLSDCAFLGPMLSPAFVTRALPDLLTRCGLWPVDPAAAWKSIHHGLTDFASAGGPVRVLRHIVNPLSVGLGYGEIRREEPISTREGQEDGGYTLRTPNALLRVWPIGSETDLDTSSKRGTAARVSPMRRAGRVLRANGEFAGIVTNGEALRLLLCDPDGPDNHVIVSLSGRTGWTSRADPPESYRLLSALACLAAWRGYPKSSTPRDCIKPRSRNRSAYRREPRSRDFCKAHSIKIPMPP